MSGYERLMVVTAAIARSKDCHNWDDDKKDCVLGLNGGCWCMAGAAAAIAALDSHDERDRNIAA
jgi:hypothetical protein